MNDSFPANCRHRQMYGVIAIVNQSVNTFENISKKKRHKQAHRITFFVFNYCGE
jgi:hypothetical protein